MEKFNKKPKLIKGGFAVDERGRVSFCNDFDFKNIKRFYVIENKSTDVIRAFHGHMKEEKYMLVICGRALLCAVQIDDIKNPSKNKKVHRFVISGEGSSILHIPAGFANGIRFLQENTKLIVFSTSSLEESKVDSYRFPPEYWGKNIWEE